jgi:hypothetical protein
LETGRKAEQGRERKTGSEKEVKKKRNGIDVKHIKSTKIYRMKE